jgi:hypothetical protein
MKEIQIDIIHKAVLAIKKDIAELNNKLNTLLLTEYGVKEVATEIGVSESLIYKLPYSDLKYVKRGKFRVYSKEDVLRYKKSLERIPLGMSYGKAS